MTTIDYNIKYHFILVVSNRQKIINKELSYSLKNTFLKLAPKYNIVCEKWSYHKDYVHILIKANKNSKVFELANIYKIASNKSVKKEFSEFNIKKDFWSSSFCLIKFGCDPLVVIKNYIESQGRKNSFLKTIFAR